MSDKAILLFLMSIAKNPIIQLVALAVVFDTIMGLFRAIKEKKFNSCIGINGAIRKVAMIISILFLAIADAILHINLIAFIPSEIWTYLGMEIKTIGIAEFFGLLFFAYEFVSILKNMTLAGLPVKRLWETVKKFLQKYTTELPDED